MRALYLSSYHGNTDKFTMSAAATQAESVIKNIIKEICLECSSKGTDVSETLAAFMVSSCSS